MDVQARNVILITVIICILAVIVTYEEHKLKQPLRTSILTGDAFVKELLYHPNETGFRETFRLKVSTFHRLCFDLANIGLSATCDISIAEEVAIFLFITAQNLSNRMAQSQFQHSGETIHRYEDPLP